MCIDDIVYIIHPNNLMRYVDATLKEIVNPDFIILDDILPRVGIILNSFIYVIYLQLLVIDQSL